MPTEWVEDYLDLEVTITNNPYQGLKLRNFTNNKFFSRMLQ